MLKSQGSSARQAHDAGARPGVVKHVARMPEVDLTDLQNEFFLPPKVRAGAWLCEDWD